MDPRWMSRPRRLRNRIRGLWPDHNPLRRASDRAEAALFGLLLVVFIAAAPLAALLGGRWAGQAAARAQRAQQADRYQVSAVLLKSAPYQAYAWTDTLVTARWTARDGSRHTGDVSAPMGTRRGATVRIWIDRSGAVSSPPLRAEQVSSQAALVAVIAPAGLASVLLVIGALGHQYLDRRRLAAWDADWRATGPQWTHQR